MATTVAPGAPVPETRAAAARGSAHAADDEIRELWTPDRMRAAAGAESPALAGSEGEPEAHGAEEGDELGTAWTGGGDIARTAGRLFFTL